MSYLFVRDRRHTRCYLWESFPGIEGLYLMGWKLLPASEFAGQTQRDWDAVNQRSGEHVLLDSHFVSSLITHFGIPGLMLGISDHGGGMALLHNAGIGRWQTFQPSQAPIGLITLANHEEAPRQILDLKKSLPISALLLGVLQQDPDSTAFVAPDRFGAVDMQHYIDTARLRITGDFENFWNARGKNLRNNLNRGRRRLQKAGIDLELVIDSDPGSVAECIQDYGRLEQTGWKGQHGTAVAVGNAQGNFYREVLEKACERREGTIYRLRMNGETVAADLCVRRSGVIVILKTAYDEDVKKHSPGMILHYEIFKKLFEDGDIHTIEFYGRALDWHRRWTDEIRKMFHLTFYRHRAAHMLRKMLK